MPWRSLAKWERFYLTFYGIQVFAALGLSLYARPPTSLESALLFTGLLGPAVLSITAWTIAIIHLLEVTVMKMKGVWEQAARREERAAVEEAVQKWYDEQVRSGATFANGPPPGVKQVEPPPARDD